MAIILLLLRALICPMTFFTAMKTSVSPDTLFLTITTPLPTSLTVLFLSSSASISSIECICGNTLGITLGQLLVLEDQPVTYLIIRDLGILVVAIIPGSGKEGVVG